jgi:hypothetical protein
MEHQHEPGSIGDLMLKAAEHCANKQRAKAALHKDAATEHKARGDWFYQAGEWDRAARAHGQAMKREAVAKACEEAAADLEDAFHLDTQDEQETVHLGVGEGDAGLPPHPPHPEPAENLLHVFDIDELPLEQLSRRQWEHLAIGIERATDWILCSPINGDWVWALQDRHGERVAVSGFTTAGEVFRIAMEHADAEKFASSKLETTDLNPQ